MLISYNIESYQVVSEAVIRHTSLWKDKREFKELLVIKNWKMLFNNH